MNSRPKSAQEPDKTEQPSDAESSFAALYRDCYPRLTTIAAAVLGRWDDAEDIVQQAAGIAVEKGIPFDTPPRIIGWLSGIVRNCALNHRKKTHGRKTYSTDPADLNSVADNAANSNSILGTSGELLPNQDEIDDQLFSALQTLGDDARCCLLLRTVLNLDYAEISQLLDIPTGTAMSHVHRSRQTLRTRLANYECAPAANPKKQS